jgi:hypothetical protein
MKIALLKVLSMAILSTSSFAAQYNVPCSYQEVEIREIDTLNGLTNVGVVFFEEDADEFELQETALRTYYITGTHTADDLSVEVELVKPGWFPNCVLRIGIRD